MDFVLDLREASDSEVLARVAYRMIERAYRRRRTSWELPHVNISSLALAYEPFLSDRLFATLMAYSLHVARGLQLKFIRATIISRGKWGTDWRSAILWEYKANRKR